MTNLTPSTHTNAATNPPTSQRSDAAESTRIAGAILTVGLTRELGDDLRSSLLDYGLMAMATCSEVKALELLRTGGLFDAIVVQLPSYAESNLHFIHQIRDRLPDIPLLVVSVGDVPDDLMTIAIHSGMQWISGSIDANELAREIRAIVALARASVPRRSGIMPIGRPRVDMIIAH